MILRRDVAQILRQMTSKNVLTCELVDGDLKIVASSILWDNDEYPVLGPSGGVEVKRILEAGTQRCIMPGYNLQWTLNAFTLLSSLFNDLTGIYFAATYGDNTASIENFLKNMRFVEWPTVPSTIQCVREHHLAKEGQTHRRVRWFRPNVATVVASAQRIIDLVDRPEIKQKREPGRKFQENEVDIPAIKFECDRPLARTVDDARQIAAARPKTLSELSKLMAGGAIDTDFLLNEEQR